MKYLIKNCKIIDRHSSYHGKKVDILVDKGQIIDIGKKIESKNAKIIEGNNLHASVGWMDIGTHLGEPGYEHRETFESLAAAAHAGGYTDIVTMPMSVPVVQTKGQIRSLITIGNALGLDIHPMAALSNDMYGKNITEFVDMHHAGAVGFSDGLQPITKGGLLLRALQYAKSFDGLIIHHSNDDSLSNGDLIHEGEISTSLGMKGSPSLAEELMIFRDIQLNAYAESRLCIHMISTLGAVSNIKTAKKKDKRLTAGVSYLNLVKSHDDMTGFDSNLKVKPILRSSKDQKALIKGINDDTIDYISSNHVPLEIERKHLEFPYADHGAIGLETAFAAMNTIANKSINLDTLIYKLTTGPRRVLGIDSPILEKDQPAKITVFDPSEEWTYTQDNIKSTSSNSPFIGASFVGRVIGVVNGKNANFQ